MAGSRITGLGYLLLRTSDFDKTVAFYRDVLGFSVNAIDQSARRDGSISRLALVTKNDCRLAINCPANPEEAHDLPEAVFAHLCLEVRNIDGMFTHLKENGINTFQTPEIQNVPVFGGVRNIYFTGPAGEIIELNESAPSQEAPEVLGLGHVALYTTNINESLDFYCKKLGFKVDTRDWILRGDKPTLIALVSKGTCRLELVHSAKSFTLPKSGRFGPLCLEVQGIEEEIEELKAEGVDSFFTNSEERFNLFGGIRNIYLTGTAGEEIELSEKIAIRN